MLSETYCMHVCTLHQLIRLYSVAHRMHFPSFLFDKNATNVALFFAPDRKQSFRLGTCCQEVEGSELTFHIFQDSLVTLQAQAALVWCSEAGGLHPGSLFMGLDPEPEC